MYLRISFYQDVRPGGKHKPINCVSRNKVAIIIPYRQRESHLKVFCNHMHPFLKRQELDYGIYIVNQVAVQNHLP